MKKSLFFIILVANLLIPSNDDVRAESSQCVGQPAKTACSLPAEHCGSTQGYCGGPNEGDVCWPRYKCRGEEEGKIVDALTGEDVTAKMGVSQENDAPQAGSSGTGAGLVPCGNNGSPCTLCHLIVGFHGLVTFLLKLIVTVALAGIFFAGVLYILSAGSESAITTAKNLATSSVIGFAIVLGAWLIINVTMWAISARPGMGIGKTNWYTFDCSSK